MPGPVRTAVLADVADLSTDSRNAQTDNDLRLILSPPRLADLRADVADVSGPRQGPIVECRSTRAGSLYLQLRQRLSQIRTAGLGDACLRA